MTSEVAEALGLSRARGALVTAVVAGGPAEQAGIKPGQVITAVNGIDVEHPDALGYRLTTVGIGHEARVTVSENGKPREVTLKLERAPETSPRDERLIEGRNPFAGAVVANLSPRLADELRMSTSLQGSSSCRSTAARRRPALVWNRRTLCVRSTAPQSTRRRRWST